MKTPNQADKHSKQKTLLIHKARIETDSMGEINVPVDAVYGAQTQRAIDNFPISGRTLPHNFICALLYIKFAAAEVNLQLSCIDSDIAKAIKHACVSLLKNENLMCHFPVDIFQTGSGTSTNMNANEVIAYLASQQLQKPVHPNDHVNYGQSSNDVIPSAIHVSAMLALEQELLPAMQHLLFTIENKEKDVQQFCKTGRTHLMDAMPVRFDQPLSAWSEQIRSNIEHIRGLQPNLKKLALGGTAVGTGVNSHPEFGEKCSAILSSETGVGFQSGNNKFALISSQDTVVALSGQLKTIAVTLMKISNDLRWMNSGPLAGLGEISLPALQPGSSIMPGKVNPVIPEATAMAAAQVIGNDSAITIGGQSGNFELNVMLPLIAANLLDSINLLSNSSRLLADKAISGFKVNQNKLDEALHKNPVLVTALNPIIGYQKAAKIAKKAYQENRPIIDVAEESTDLARDVLESLLDPARLVTHDQK